jgi:two-component system OmpR family sensor kinase
MIMGYVDAIAEGLVAGPLDARRILKKSLSECRRMRGTIEKLILLDRLDGNDPALGTVDVAVLALTIAESMKPLAPSLQVDVPSNGIKAMVGADETELRQAIVNIVDNSVKYAPGSPIDVRVSTAGDIVIVEVVDAGPGMPAGDRERVFERFHRGSNRGDAEGSGLGLAIAKRAVERAGGKITLSSDLGRGTAVRLYLPALKTATKDRGWRCLIR